MSISPRSLIDCTHDNSSPRPAPLPCSLSSHWFIHSACWFCGNAGLIIPGCLLLRKVVLVTPFYLVYWLLVTCNTHTQRLMHHHQFTTDHTAWMALNWIERVRGVDELRSPAGAGQSIASATSSNISASQQHRETWDPLYISGKKQADKRKNGAPHHPLVCPLVHFVVKGSFRLVKETMPISIINITGVK